MKVLSTSIALSLLGLVVSPASLVAQGQQRAAQAGKQYRPAMSPQRDRCAAGSATGRPGQSVAAGRGRPKQTISFQ